MAEEVKIKIGILSGHNSLLAPIAQIKLHLLL